MRHEDAGLALWVATDASARDHEHACEQALARVAEAAARPTIRQRAGAAVIALGERLAGDGTAGERLPVPRRRLAGHTS